MEYVFLLFVLIYLFFTGMHVCKKTGHFMETIEKRKDTEDHE